DGTPDAGQLDDDARMTKEAVDVARPGAPARPRASPNAGRIVCELEIASANLTPGELRGADAQSARRQSRCQEALHTMLLCLEQTGGWQLYPRRGAQKETCAVLHGRTTAHARWPRKALPLLNAIGARRRRGLAEIHRHGGARRDAHVAGLGHQTAVLVPG